MTPLQTRTRVLILQHPRERHVPINTARLARLCLPGATLRMGVDFAADPVVQALVAGRDGGPPPYVLYPGPDALDLAEAVPPGPITLVVLDGTWGQARKLLTRNPALAALPKLRLAPAAPSRYRIRREPAEHCVATIEALALALGTLEGDPRRFTALLRPFEAMVERQLAFAGAVGNGRHRLAAQARAERAAGGGRPSRSPDMLRARASDLVVVHGEANAWPVRIPGRHPPEIVHWLARRQATGETFAAVVAPRGPLAPSTPSHLRLPAQTLLAGEPWPSFVARWRAFVREGDVLCSWGHFPTATLAAQGVNLPAAHVDLRVAANRRLRARVGTLEACLARLGPGLVAPTASQPGRGGARMALLCAVVDAMLAAPA